MNHNKSFIARSLRTSALVSFAIFTSTALVRAYTPGPIDYIEPSPYEHFSCAQIGTERRHIKAEMAGVSSDPTLRPPVEGALAVAGSFIFAPQYFMAGGDPRVAELARLQGELDDLQRVAARNACKTSRRK